MTRGTFGTEAPTGKTCFVCDNFFAAITLPEVCALRTAVVLPKAIASELADGISGAIRPGARMKHMSVSWTSLLVGYEIIPSPFIPESVFWK